MASLTVFDGRGFTLSRESVSCDFGGGGKRGKLEGRASSASFRRFRSWCVRWYVPDSPCYGITLTVPHVTLMSADDFKMMWHKMNYWLNRNHVPCIWRVELQQRGMPHIHAVVYSCPETILRMFSRWFELLCDEVFSIEICDGVGDLVSISRAYVRGASYSVEMQRLEDNHRAFRYLVAHTSKAKSSQLGFSGRNWGVCCRNMFRPVGSVTYQLLDYEYYTLIRWLRRLTRRRVNGISGCSSWLCNPSTVEAMRQFILESCR